jgi:hypothetical protein
MDGALNIPSPRRSRPFIVSRALRRGVFPVCAFLHVPFFSPIILSNFPATDFPLSRNVSAGLRATSWKMHLLKISNIKIAKRFRLFGDERQQ